MAGAPSSTRRAWAAGAVASVSQFVYMFDAGIVALSLPEIQATFPGTSRTTMGWVAGIFLIAQASFLLVGGRLGDRRGRKVVFLSGLSLFCVGGALTAVAPDIWFLLAARAAQGVGAALLTSGALALVLPMFAPSMAPKVVAAWGMVGASAALISPTLGGLIVERSWRWGFAATLPLGVLAVVAGRRLLVETERESHTGRLDRVSLLLAPPALGVLMLVLSRGRSWGWGSPLTIGLGTAAIAVIVALVRRSAQATDPLLDLRIFRHRGFNAFSSSGVLQQMGFFSWWLTTPIVGRELWGWSVAEIGVALAVTQVMALIGSPLAAWLVNKAGQTAPVVVGLALITVSLTWLTTTTTPGSDYWVAYAPMVVPFGLGCAMAGTVLSGGALAALPEELLGAGNSYVQLTRRLGGAAGVALGLALLGEAEGTAIAAGAQRAWTFSVVVHAAALVPLAASRWWPQRLGAGGRRLGARQSKSRTPRMFSPSRIA